VIFSFILENFNVSLACSFVVSLLVPD